MLLSHALAPIVAAKTRARGAQYLRQGAVQNIAFSDGTLDAAVIGSQVYEVHVEASNAGAAGWCTCPSFADHLEVCKHIWAAILATEAQGAGAALSVPAHAEVDFEPLDPPDDFDKADENFDDAPMHIVRPLRQTRAPAGGGSTRASKAGKPLPPTQLTRALQAIAMDGARAAPASTIGKRSEMVFVVDMPASQAAGALVVETMTRSRKANGEWNRPSPLPFTPLAISALPQGAVRHLLERLLGAGPYYEHNVHADYRELRRFALRGAPLRDAAPALCAPGRCLARTPGLASPAPPRPKQKPRARRSGWGWAQPAAPPPPPVYSPLVFDEGPPWQLAVSVREDEPHASFELEASFTRPGERLDLSDTSLVLRDGILVSGDRMALVDAREGWPWLEMLRHGRLTVPASERLALVDAILSRPGPVGDLPPSLRPDVEELAPRPRLRLRPAKYQPAYLDGEALADYGGLEVSPDVPHLYVRNADGSRVVRRDRDAEGAFGQTLHELGFRPRWSPDAGRPVPQIGTKHLQRVVRDLLDAGWHVEAKGLVYRQAVSTAAHVRSGIDWLELEAHADYGSERIPLSELLAALRRGDGFVTLGDGSLGLLPEDWLRRQGLLAGLGQAHGDRIRFKHTQVALLDALLAERADVTFDQAVGRARAELSAFDGIGAADAPAAFTGVLRGYQRDGLGWLLFLRRFGFGGCLADDMGLGKTIMVLALAAAIRRSAPPAAHERDVKAAPARPWLVVAPRSLIFNWQQEAAKFTPDLRVLDYTGTQRAGDRDRLDEHDLVLTTYGTMRRDIEHLAGVTFDTVVLDEAQAIKNATSASAKAARLLQADHRLALSGTPIENHIGELWSLFEFLNPGLLGTSSAFHGLTGRGALDDASIAQLARGLKPFIMRRTKAQVAPELPQKTEQTLYCELKKPQRTMYDELRAHYRHRLLDTVDQNGLGRTKIQILEALLRLRQAACHPGLVDAKRTKDPSAKLDVLLPHIAQAVEEGHKTLVFSQFTSLLAILRRRLDADGVAYEYLDGHTRDRDVKVRRFQEDRDCRLFLISLKAGGVGLNLTAAEYVFLLDPWWNPAVEAQAIDRAHRIGQARQVFAYRLIAKGTVEERVLELQRRKRSLADAVLTGDGGLLKELKREDLELLLS